jgi:lysyl-tRNA synthetase class 2
MGVTALLAIRALGDHAFGQTRAELLAFTLGLLVTFLLVRVNTRLIRARVSWWFHDITPGGTHIHHMVFGVIIMVVTGIITFALAPMGLTLQVLAFVFGAGAALTLDEFALILHLEDVYWLEEGRISVDAVVVVAAAGALSLLTGPPLIGADIGKSSIWSLTIVALVNLTFAVISIVKGKLWTGFVGIWVPVLALFGAVRLARPDSPWARARYVKRPQKMARAQAREDHRRGRAGRFRDWFYDLIAGKPSLPPFGPGASKSRDGDD